MPLIELGMVIYVSPVQPLKASFPIDVTELGMVIDVSPVQPAKAVFPMLVTLNVRLLYVTISGIVISPEYYLPDVTLAVWSDVLNV